MPATVIKCHGGKGYLARRIIDLMPPHTRYLEAYAGGLSVLMAKDPFAYSADGCAEWVCDTNGDLIAFWQCMASPVLFEQFKRVAEALPVSEGLFHASREALKRWVGGENAAPSVVARAIAFFVTARQSRQGLGVSYLTPTSRTRRGMNEHVSAWLTAVDGLPEVFARMRRVEVKQSKALDVLRELDGPDLVAYFDPPYLPSTRSSDGEYGIHEMNPSDYLEMLQVLSKMQGRFILSGYASELYGRFAEEHGWHRVTFELPNNASGAKMKERKTECLWMNYEPPPRPELASTVEPTSA